MRLNSTSTRSRAMKVRQTKVPGVYKTSSGTYQVVRDAKYVGAARSLEDANRIAAAAAATAGNEDDARREVSLSQCRANLKMLVK